MVKSYERSVSELQREELKQLSAIQEEMMKFGQTKSATKKFSDALERHKCKVKQIPGLAIYLDSNLDGHTILKRYV